VEIIDQFYRIYHSMRFVGNTLIMRLNRPLQEEQIAALEEEFLEIIEPGSRLQLCAPFPEEQDQPDLLHLPRLCFEFNHFSYGLLKAFIRRINTL
jgi:hypothetical protein